MRPMRTVVSTLRRKLGDDAGSARHEPRVRATVAWACRQFRPLRLRLPSVLDRAGR